MTAARIKHLEARVESLKTALDLAQQRIDELEKAFGTEDETAALRRLGLEAQCARIVHLLMTQPIASEQQVRLAMYADNPDRMFDVCENVVRTRISQTKRALRVMGVAVESLGSHSGYHMPPAAKARLQRLMASNARVLRGGTSDMRIRLRAAE